jgi:hypothetical protein
LVISKLVPSEYVPVAINCSVTPTGMEVIAGLAGPTVRAESVAEFTVRVVLPEALPKTTLRVVVPGVRAMARPLLVMVATDGADELQVT